MSVGDDESGGSDFQAVSAVADGTPYVRMSAVYPFLWNEEQGKTWYTLNNTISSDGINDQSFSICVPPGNYTLQYWDVCGGGGSCSAGDGFNAGTPPDTSYGSGWEIGDPSRQLVVAAGQETDARVYAVHQNVPASDNFYGGAALWTYGSCVGSALCPDGTTCNSGVCDDLAYDMRNCGSIGNACDAGSCCSSACTDVGSDPSNCGGCGVSCGAGSECTGGECVSIDAGCGVIMVELGRDFPGDPTNYQGLFAVADGAPHLNDGTPDPGLWSTEQAKTWYPLNTETFSEPDVSLFYSACVPPGNYTVQLWNDGCINNQGGCGTFSNGTPPSPVYVWQIGTASQLVSVSVGRISGMSVLHTTTNVPAFDSFYGSYALWSYGGCGTFTPPKTSPQVVSCPAGTTCFDGACDDLGYDIRNCGAGGNACTGQDCCNGGCADIGSDANNCGICGNVCPCGQGCSNGTCAPPPTDGLVAYWDFDEGSGATLNDSSGNGYSASLAGSPAWVTGVAGDGLLFNGGGSQEGTVGTLPTISDNASVSVWAKVAGTGSGAFSRVVSWWDALEIAAGTGQDGVPAGNLTLCTANTCWIDEGLPLGTGWNHIVVTVSDGTTELYLNGVLVETYNGTGVNPFTDNPFNLSGTMYIGNSLDGSAFDGTIDDLRVYNRVLSSAEVAQLYGGICSAR